jgi:hypothetical protein
MAEKEDTDSAIAQLASTLRLGSIVAAAGCGKTEQIANATHLSGGRRLILTHMLLQNPDDLLFRKAAALHALVLVVGQNELQTGLSPGGKVSAVVSSQSPENGNIRCCGGRLSGIAIPRSPTICLERSSGRSCCTKNRNSRVIDCSGPPGVDIAGSSAAGRLHIVNSVAPYIRF